jgi:hypothetical protein
VGQHKRNHVMARAHWRDQAARLVAAACFDVEVQRHFEGWRAECAVGPSRYVVADSADRATAIRDAWAGVVRRICDGQVRFDVALVRSYCERLIAEAERRAADRVVFIDWTRAQGPKGSLATGLGPENREPGAFMLPPCCRLESSVHVCPKSPIVTYSACDCGDPRSFAANPACATCGGSGFTPRAVRRGPCPDCRGTPADFYRPGCFTCRGESPRGGWPGRLAREYGWERCSGCEGRGRIEWLEMKRPAGSMVLADGSVSHSYTATRVRERCVACKGRGRTRKTGISPGVAAGPGIARTAQRLLDTLDGRCPWAPGAKAQPSVCLQCSGVATHVAYPHPGPPPEGYAAIHNIASCEIEDGKWSWTWPCSDCRGTGHNLAGFLPEFDGRRHEADLTHRHEAQRPGPAWR